MVSLKTRENAYFSKESTAVHARFRMMPITISVTLCPRANKTFEINEHSLVFSAQNSD